MTNCADNNSVKLVGTVVSEKTFNHDVHGEKFYSFDLEVPRLSDSSDIFPVTASERLLDSIDFKIGQKVVVDGQAHSYENEKNKFTLEVFAKEIREQVKKDAKIDPNEIMLNGFICKEPLCRTTPFGREIADILLAVNREYDKSDYMLCMGLGKNARYCQKLEIDANVKIWGRIQSRQYEKKFADGTSEIRRTYEVWISKIEEDTENTTSNL